MAAVAMAAATLLTLITSAGGGSSGGGATISTPSLTLTVSPEGNVTEIMDRGARLNRVLDTQHKLLYAYFAGGAQAGVTAVEQSDSTIVATFASMGTATVTIDVINVNEAPVLGSNYLPLNGPIEKSMSETAASGPAVAPCR